MIDFRKEKFWNIKITMGQEFLTTVTKSWTIILLENNEKGLMIRAFIERFKNQFKEPFDPINLRNFNFGDYGIQRQWIAIRNILIENFHRNDYENNELLLDYQTNQG